MSNSYYLYINQDDLNRFLVENLIFPYNEQFSGRRSLALSYNNCLLLTKKRASKDSIIKQCADGIIPAIVVEINANYDKSKVVWQDSDSILINDVISFCCVTKIYCVNEKIPGFLFNDLYLFDSLVGDDFFQFGEDDLDLKNVINYNNTFDIDDIITKWSKIQAFYCARFGYLDDVQYNKKTIISRRNIDSDSFKYISDETYDDFVNNYFGVVSKKKSQPTLFDLETTFLNDNFEKLLSSIFIKNDDISTEWKKHLALYEILYNYKDGDSLKSMILGKGIFEKEISILNTINKEQLSNIKYLRGFFDDNSDRLAITLFIIVHFIELDIDKAKLYINNFTEHSEFEKELLSMYALAKGMKGISVVIKQKPDTLLFAFNKSKKYFNCYVDICQSYKDYYLDRNYYPTIIMQDGFDLKIYDEKQELAYIRKDIIKELINKYDISEKLVNKIIKKSIKGLKSKEIHNLFLKIKEEESE